MKKKYLSKSDIVDHIRCPLSLWLKTNNPDVVDNDDDNPMIFNGNMVGQAAREYFKDGSLVNWETWETAIADTKRLMADKTVNTIYEATFYAEGVLVRADVMQRTKKSWKIIEVKSTTKPDATHYIDVAIQRYVIGKAGVSIASTMLLYVYKEFVYAGNDNYDELFVGEDVTVKCAELEDMVSDTIIAAGETLKGKQPVVEMSPHCKRGHVCAAKKHCESMAPSDHISFLPRGGTVQKKIAVDGFTRITEIPAKLLKSETHIKVYDVTMSGNERYLDGAKAVIDNLPWPRHFLDFETIQYAVPRWKGVRSWRQVPFQWSDHAFGADGTMNHTEFLDMSGADPRRAFAESLVEQCGNDEGVVLVYHKSFEQMIMRELKMDFPDLADKLQGIIDRCFDLLPLMKDHYYHPDMQGSWSIKKVLNCFVPEMDYGDLEDVHNGLEAQMAYLRMVDPNWTGDKKTLMKNSREYCKYDTLSMVKLVEGIMEREG